MTTEEPSNVVLITVDSLRADAIAPYNFAQRTPVIDSLAEDGTVFEHAFATGNWTPFSFPSILASRPVFADTDEIGVTATPTLSEVLSEADISTGGFNAANGFLTSHWGYDEGFDEFEPFISSVGSSLYSRYLAKHPTVEAWLQLATSPIRRLSSRLRGQTDDRPFLDTSRMFDVEHAASEFIEGSESPFFLWIHYMDTHTPYVPAPRYIRDVSSDLFGTHRMIHAHTRTGLGLEVGEQTLADLRTLYQAAVRQVDASIGRLLETLSATGKRDETAIVVAGDHGEEFQEHGHLAHYPKLYDELIHVPLLVDVPGQEGANVESHVGLDAIPPTVAELFDVDAPELWDGASLTPSLFGGKPPDSAPVVSVTVRGEEVTIQPIPRSLDDGDLLVSVRDAEWTYIENIADGSIELYHRPDDSVQLDDRGTDPTPDEQAVIDRFGGIAETHVERIRSHGETDTGDVDEDLETRLSALGYR